MSTLLHMHISAVKKRDAVLSGMVACAKVFRIKPLSPMNFLDIDQSRLRKVEHGGISKCIYMTIPVLS